MSDQSTVLAFDTALSGCNVALQGDGIAVFRQIETEREQAKILVPTIQEVLAEAGIGFKDVDLIATTIGPGSFTGLRIGLSTARSLSLALEIPAVGVSTLELMARHYIDTQSIKEQNLLIVLETKRSDYYNQLFDSSGLPLTEAFSDELSVMLEKMAALGQVSVGGDAVNRLQDEMSATPQAGFNFLPETKWPDPMTLATLSRDPEKQLPLEPLYLRGADVSKPNSEPRVMAGNI